MLVVASDAARAMKHGVRAVGVDVDPHLRPDEMSPHRALRDLQFQLPVGNAVVVADLALLLDAQDLVEIDAGIGVKADPSQVAATANRAL